jgi:hypothetical protein
MVFHNTQNESSYLYFYQGVLEVAQSASIECHPAASVGCRLFGSGLAEPTFLQEITGEMWNQLQVTL